MDKNKVDEAAELNKEITTKKKTLDELKNNIKSEGIGSFEGNSYIATVSTMCKQSFDTDMAVKIAKKSGIKWILKDTIDEDALQDGIAAGEIDSELFKDCVTQTETKVIKFKKRSKK